MPVLGKHIKKLIAIDQSAVAVDHLHAIAVAVERDAEIGAGFDDRAHERLRPGRADVAIDVETVGPSADRFDIRAELGEHFRCDLVGRAMRAIEHDRNTAQAER